MPSYCKIILMGHLTRNPELRYTPNGTPVATLGMASNRRFKQGEELKEEVLFVDVVLFGKMAETAGQYLHKGDCVLIEGRLQQRRWEQDDGQKRSKHEIVGDTMKFVTTKERQSGEEPEHARDPAYDQ